MNVVDIASLNEEVLSRSLDIQRAAEGVRRALQERRGRARSARLYGWAARAIVATLRTELARLLFRRAQGFESDASLARGMKKIRSQYAAAKRLDAMSRSAITRETALPQALGEAFPGAEQRRREAEALQRADDMVAFAGMAVESARNRLLVDAQDNMFDAVGQAAGVFYELGFETAYRLVQRTWESL